MNKKNGFNEQQKILADQIDNFDHREVLKKEKWKNRFKRLFKICLILAFVFVLGIAASYIYIKQIESKMHKTKGIYDVIVNPVRGEPINFLILGSDTRGEEQARSDTIIILRVEPSKKKVAMVSIPRDTRVDIPGYGMNKINSANALGGPKLTIKTVSEFADLPIHHYILTDFKGFKKMVDALGGVDMVVEEPMADKMSGAFFTTGPHHFNGEQALAYVRARYTDKRGDFGRMDRQQKLLKAIFKQALQLRKALKIPKLINVFAENTDTDLTTVELYQLSKLINSLKKEDLDSAIVTGQITRFEGVSYVVPDEIEVEAIFDALREGKKLPSVESEAEAIPKKKIHLSILNGVGDSGVAQDFAKKLGRKGYTIEETGNAGSFDYYKTVLLYRPGQNDKAAQFSRHVNIFQIRESATVKKPIDLILIIGKDYKKIKID